MLVLGAKDVVIYGSMCCRYPKLINRKDESLPREQGFVSREDAREMAE